MKQITIKFENGVPTIKLEGKIRSRDITLGVKYLRRFYMRTKHIRRPELEVGTVDDKPVRQGELLPLEVKLPETDSVIDSNVVTPDESAIAEELDLDTEGSSSDDTETKTEVNEDD